LLLIAKTYVLGWFFFDFAATVPGYLILVNAENYQKLYWLKVIRFVHIREVWDAVEDYIRQTINRFGLPKPAVMKLTYIIILIIKLFSAIHYLACIWIYIGKITECSWIHQGGNGAGCDAGI